MKCLLAKFVEIEIDSWNEFSLELPNSFQSIILHKSKDQQLQAFKNFCPHQGRRLDYISGKFLLDEKGHLICPAHGAEFETKTGECINGPCKGQSLQAIEVFVESENIYAVIEK
jgi:nitrite reductase/ring-hydroxylating ferredoxin subunit